MEKWRRFAIWRIPVQRYCFCNLQLDCIQSYDLYPRTALKAHDRSELFARGLAKGRCSTPEQRPWRGGTYDQIREVMPLQGILSIGRMCELVRFRRASVDRPLRE